MRITLILISLLLVQFAIGQENLWKGSCYDESGKPQNPADFSNQVYQVKKHKKKTPVSLNIKSIKIGSKVINVNIEFNEKIEFETPVIDINESYSVKLILGKTTENEINKFLYKLIVFKKENKSNCLRPLSTFNSFYEVYNQTMSLNLFSIGYENSENFFRIEEGWIKLN